MAKSKKPRKTYDRLAGFQRYFSDLRLSQELKEPIEVRPGPAFYRFARMKGLTQTTEVLAMAVNMARTIPQNWLLRVEIDFQPPHGPLEQEIREVIQYNLCLGDIDPIYKALVKDAVDCLNPKQIRAYRWKASPYTPRNERKLCPEDFN